MALDQEWNDLLGKIRSVDGFADFLRPPRLDSLSRAAAGGSIVVVNISRWRSDALVVTTDGVQPPLALPSASREATVDWTVRFLDAVHRFQVAEQLAYESPRRFREGDRSPAAFQAYHVAATELDANQRARLTIRSLRSCPLPPCPSRTRGGEETEETGEDGSHSTPGTVVAARPS
jgi:hypothetical protein